MKMENQVINTFPIISLNFLDILKPWELKRKSSSPVMANSQDQAKWLASTIEHFF